MEAFVDAKMFPLILLVLGLFEFLSTYLSVMPAVQQKKLLEERAAEITSIPERQEMMARIANYDRLFLAFRIVGVILIVFGLWGLT